MPTESGQGTPSQQQTREVALRVAVCCILLLALALLAQKVSIAILDPNFDGDAGIRMNNAARPIFRLGNRVWLPYLQIHIWAFYLLRLPYRFYNLIPCLYFFAAVVSLGLLGLRLLGRTWSGVLFTLAVMFCFAEQLLVSRMATTLFQEILSTALFYALLYLGGLHLRKGKVLLLLGGVALLTRDIFQIYLLSLTVLNWKTILSDRMYRRSFLLLWAIPVTWLLSIPVGYLVHDGRLPRSFVEWPLMINKEEAAVSHLTISLASLWTALLESGAIVLLASVVLAQVVMRWSAMPARPVIRKEAGEFMGVFGPFSVLSLGIAYSAVALFDPNRVTFGNIRMAFPLLEHLFIWALLALAGTYGRRGLPRYAARVILMAGLLASLSPLATWLPRSDSEAKTLYPDLERLVREASPNATPVVCFGPEDVFDTFERFIAPTLYTKRRYLPAEAEIPKDCAVWISRPEAVPLETGNFEKIREYNVRTDLYYVYRRR